jgi:S1-C subfamily serine protease
MPDWETLAWPRREHLQRVFHVRSGNSRGTAFALDVENRQYLVTALHVAKEAAETATLDIYFRDVWTPFFPVNLVGLNTELDVAVFALATRIVAPGLNIDVNSAGCRLGQEVFILGYPLGELRGYPVDPGFPLPVIKRGVAALFHPGPPQSLYISASANPGFSGGPVYFANQETGKATLTAIVIGELAYQVDVENDSGVKIGKVWMPSNLVKCAYIDHVLNLIEANPIGRPLQ